MTSTSITRPVARIGGAACPIQDAVASARSAVATAARETAESLDDEECRALLVGLTVLSNQIAELELRVLARAEQVRAGQQAGASSTATWLALETGQSAKATHAKARLARAVAPGSPRVRAALAAGDILPAQAAAILQETAGLTRGRDEVVRGLLEHAAGNDASSLRVRAREIARTAATARRDDHPLALVAPVPGQVGGRDHPSADGAMGSEVPGTAPGPPVGQPVGSPVGSPVGLQAGSRGGPPSGPSAAQSGSSSGPSSGPCPGSQPGRSGDGTGRVALGPATRPTLRERAQQWWGRRHGTHRRSRGPSDPVRSSLESLARAAHGAFGWHVHLAETCPHEADPLGRSRLAHPRA